MTKNMSCTKLDDLVHSILLPSLILKGVFFANISEKISPSQGRHNDGTETSGVFFILYFPRLILLWLLLEFFFFSG